jgi:hypothetical protein
MTKLIGVTPEEIRFRTQGHTRKNHIFLYNLRRLMSQTFKLYRLQQLDSQIDRLQARLRDIDRALGESEILNQAQNRFNQVEEMLNKERNALNKAEGDVQNQRIKIEQTEATLYGGKVKNPKELQDLQNEAASLKRYKTLLEDRQLEVMMQVEEVEALYALRQAELEEARQKHAQEHQELAIDKTNIEKEVTSLNSERLATAEGISQEEIALYNQIRQQRRGIAVAKVADRACSACGSILHATVLQAARTPNQITRCPNCGRILYAL